MFKSLSFSFFQTKKGNVPVSCSSTNTKTSAHKRKSILFSFAGAGSSINSRIIDGGGTSDRSGGGGNDDDSGDDCIWGTTVKFIPPVKGGKVIKVYDGDTITIASKMPLIDDDRMFRFSVRLLGIDSPEIKGKTNVEKELAIKSRDALSVLIFNKNVELKNVSLDKYGRLLAYVYLGDINVNQWLLDNNYAIEYDGGTKRRPKDWE